MKIYRHILWIGLISQNILHAYDLNEDPQKEDMNLQQERIKGLQYREDSNLEQEQARGLQLTEDPYLEQEQTRDIQFEEDQSFKQEREIGR